MGGGEGNRVGAAGAIRSCPILVGSGRSGHYHVKAANRMALGLSQDHGAHQGLTTAEEALFRLQTTTSAARFLLHHLR
jgi:hypothetical protein